MKDVTDWLLYLGLLVMVAGIACFDWRWALIVAGACLVGVSFMRAYTHAQ